MPKQIGQLNQTVSITLGFPGTYIYTGGTSYYLNGNSNTGVVHFSVPGGSTDDFTKFHITHSISGSNVQVYFKNGLFDGPDERVYINTRNLPSHKIPTWHSFWHENESKFISAAGEFWTQLNG